MDANQFKYFMDQQAQMFSQLLQGINKRSGAQSNAVPVSQSQPCAANVSVPQPSPLSLVGDMEVNFEFFERSWNDYAKAIGMDRWPEADNPQKVSFLLSIVGEPARKKFFNFELTAEQRANPEVALLAIKAKVVSKRNILLDRLDFFNSEQQCDETIDDFTTRLKILAKMAHLGVLEEELVTFKIVTANKWSHLRTKMIIIPDITREKAVDICRAEEITTQRAKDLHVPSTPAEVNKVEKPLNKKHNLCKFCGDRHEFAKGVCPALGKRCKRCNGKNHYKKVCKSKHSSKRRSKKIKEIREEDSETDNQSSSSNDASSEQSDCEYEIGKIFDYSDKGGSVLAELDLKFSDSWSSVVCEIDTGANTSLIGYKWLLKLSNEVVPSLSPSTYRLQSFGGNPIKVLGQVKIPCRRSGRRYLLVLQVVDVNHRPLLSAKASRILGLIKFCNSVNVSQSTSTDTKEKLLQVYRIKAEKMIQGHASLFSGYGQFPGTVTLEVDNTIPPSIQPPRRIPIAIRPKLEKELNALEKDKIIVKEPQHTEWVSNIVIVQRGGEQKGIRICLDPIHLNKSLKRPHLQFNTLDEILPDLGKAKVFSTMDTKKGFWHVVLDEPSSKLTTFWTPFGRYRWLRMPFGIAPAPEIFRMKLQEIIQGLKGVESLADDILVYGVGDSFEEALINHNISLKNLLCCLDKNCVRLNKDKLKLCQTSVQFFGHVLTDCGLEPDQSKISTIRNFPTPTNHKEVHRFIGMVNYLSRYIRNLSVNLTHLRKLILQDQQWNWTSVENEEFLRIKSMVSDIKTLCYYDVNLPLIIECDASCFGLGVALFQGNGVIGYASRTLTPTERNYAQIEKELLAIVFACTRFDQLVVGNPKTIVKTDHKPLLNVFRKPLLTAPKRLQHMLLNLQRYNIVLEYVTGKENVVADALSRAPFDDKNSAHSYQKQNIYKIFQELEKIDPKIFLSISDARLSEIIQETEKDKTLQLIINYIQYGWPSSADQVPDDVKIYYNHRAEYSTQDGLIFRNDRILIPYTLRRSLIDKCHTSHNGIEATLQLARANLFWPGMSSQIKNAVQGCPVCAKFASSQPNPPMLSHSIPIYPFQLISMDVFFLEYRNTKCKWLVTVDHYSDFFELDILPNLTPESVIAACKENFARHGTPQRVITDNGTHFVSPKMVEFATNWEFEHVTSSPHHQQANGKSEAAVKIAKRLIRKADETGADYWFALLHWRNIPNKIGSSPAARLFSRSTRCSVPTAAANLIPKVVENVPESIEKNRKLFKKQYDKQSRDLPILQSGSPVFVQLNPDASKLWSPGTVSSKLNDRSYLVNVGGKDYRRSLVNLKPRKEPESSPCHPAQPKQTLDEKQTTTTPPSPPAAIRCQPPNDGVIESPPTTTTSTSSNMLPSTSKINSPTRVDHTSRPKREIRIPTKLQDYELEY
ncbi:uncharacterized protein K02A2.6-like [Uranotaenia lowii]|uniref:uncharacterized protein K02A2.6-like n=1 Tax=Uranotaenia lowii TaxID=190385 RepID=UPI00247838B2|nr:uncharacterized protein K02A2.6-like [Uranotaenia lowii]